MTITINLSPATLEKVQSEAQATGKDVDTIVREALEIGLTHRKRPLAEVLKPINDAMQASGLSEQAVNALFERELKAHRAERRSAKAHS